MFFTCLIKATSISPELVFAVTSFVMPASSIAPELDSACTLPFVLASMSPELVVNTARSVTVPLVNSMSPESMAILSFFALTPVTFTSPEPPFTSKSPVKLVRSVCPEPVSTELFAFIFDNSKSPEEVAI
ncbi:conserved hypothetical protein [Listeria monocytogenes str. 4b H7858]|nr:conserved hypothetical protein [Listeria monocytogenes str. 4b H7858] [Listeria monocytogenes serotype 4b str. H7858]